MMAKMHPYMHKDLWNKSTEKSKHMKIYWKNKCKPIKSLIKMPKVKEEEAQQIKLMRNKKEQEIREWIKMMLNCLVAST